jgi:hypothetical protein
MQMGKGLQRRKVNVLYAILTKKGKHRVNI